MTARIGIAGITGRMGRLLVEEARAAGATVSGGYSITCSPPTSPSVTSAIRSLRRPIETGTSRARPASTTNTARDLRNKA